MVYLRYTGKQASVPGPEYYDSSAMTLLAYAVRRTIGAAIVFLIVVMLTMFAIGNIGLPHWSVPEMGPFPSFVNPWFELWASFPAFALAALGLIAGLVVVRRRLAR